MANSTNYDIVNGNRSDDRSTITTYVFSPSATLKSFSLGGDSDGDTIAIDALSSDFKVKVKKDTMTLIGLKNTPSAGVVIKIQLDNTDALGGTGNLAFLDGTVVIGFTPKEAGNLKGAWTFGGMSVTRTLNLSKSASYDIDSDHTYSDLDIEAQRELNGQTFTLTTSVDSIPGMIGSKGTTSTLGHDTILAVATGSTKTLNFGDQIDGGEGSDLMRIVTDQVEVSLAGKQIANVEDLLVEMYPSEDDELDGNDLDLDTLNVNNVAFETVTVDFNDGIENDGGSITNVNKVSAVTIQNLDIGSRECNELNLEYAGDGAINNSLTLNNISNGELQVNFNHPDNGLEGDDFIEQIAGGTYTVNVNVAEDLKIDVDEGGGAGTLNLNIKGEASGIEIDNNEGFAGTQNATVNIRLDADLEGEGWDLADIKNSSDDTEATGQLTINIIGDGNLTVDGIDDWYANTVVNAGSARGDIDIDFDKKSDVVSATTNLGDDRLVLDSGYFDGNEEEDGVIVDMKTGRNTLGVSNCGWGYDDVNALDFTEVSVSGAQTLELHGSNVYIGEDATLNMAGLGNIDTLLISDNYYGEDFYDAEANEWVTTTLSVRFAEAVSGNGIDEVETLGFPTSFTIEAVGEIDDGRFDTGLIQNLTIKAGDDADIEGIESEALKTLNISGDDVWVDLYSDDNNLSEMTSLTVTAEHEADVDLVGSQIEIAPEALDEYVAFNIDGGFTGGGNNTTWSVELDFEGSNHDVAIQGTGRISAGQLQVLLQDAIREEFGQYGLTNDLIVLSGNGNNRTITVNWPTTINGPDLLDINVDASANVNKPTIDVVVDGGGAGDGFDFDLTDGGDDDGDDGDTGGDGEVLYVGDGFNSLADVNVTAGEDADVYIEDAYGQFDVTVSAGNEDHPEADAYVYIYDANVDAVNVTAVDYANLVLSNVAGVSSINVTGDTVELDDGCDLGINNVTMTGAGVVTLTATDLVHAYFDEVVGMNTLNVVSGDDDGDSYIYLVDTITLTTINLTGVTDNDDEDDDNGYIYVDASAAAFGSAVTIRFGNSDADYVNDDSAEIKETFAFTSNFGYITLDGFDIALDAEGDKIDLSVFAGINGIGDLSFNGVGDDVEITASGTQFAGTILLVGVSQAELEAGHFIF